MPKFVDLDGGRNVAEIHKKPPRHCHKMVRETARAMAADFYEMAAKDDIFFKQFPSQKQYVHDKWGAFVDVARETMAKMLASSYHESMKQAIYEALQYDTAAKGGNIQVLQ